MYKESLNVQPVFIVCHARAGSTLLRYMLETHENIYCPPELHLGAYLNKLLRLLSIIHYDVDIKEIHRLANLHITQLMGDKIQSKKIWCDKSITTVEHLDLVKEVFPHAKFICLYRNCLDFIHSAKEVTDFKIYGYEFESYIQDSETHLIDVFAGFWCDKVASIMDFEMANPSICLRTNQESLVLDTSTTINKIFEFLRLKVPENFEEKIFSIKHQPGAGDFKIRYKNKIDIKSIGKGYNIPIERISNENITRVNKLCVQLGYPPINKNVNIYAPDHFLIGSGDKDLKNGAAILLDQLIQILRRRLTIHAFLSSSKNCMLIIRDIEHAIYNISVTEIKITRADELSNIEEKISMDLNTLFEILDNRNDFGTALANGKIIVRGDYAIITKFLFLFVDTKLISE